MKTRKGPKKLLKALEGKDYDKKPVDRSGDSNKGGDGGDGDYDDDFDNGGFGDDW